MLKYQQVIELLPLRISQARVTPDCAVPGKDGLITKTLNPFNLYERDSVSKFTNHPSKEGALLL